MLASSLHQVINRVPVVVHRETSLQSAIAAMQRASFTAIWVTESSPSERPQLIGGVFPEQLSQALSTVSKPAEEPLDSCMRVDLPQLPQADLFGMKSPVEWLLTQFAAYQVNDLPIVNRDGAFLGAINQWSLLQTCCPLATPAKLGRWLEKTKIGFFTMMLDEPLPWGALTDRALNAALTHCQIHSCNEAFSTQHGLSHTELMGKAPADVWPPDLATEQRWQRLFDLGTLVETVQTNRLDDNTSVWIEGYYQCLYDDQGRILGYLGIQRDVTQLRDIQARLRQQERYLYLAAEMQQTLLASKHQFVPDSASRAKYVHGSLNAASAPLSFEAALSDLKPLYQDLLSQLGHTAQADRVSLAEYRGGDVSWQLSWPTGTVSPPARPTVPEVDDSYPAEWLARLSTGQVMHACAAELSHQTPSHWLPDIQSVLVLPLIIDQQLWGIIQLDNCRAVELWGAAEIQLLIAAAAVIVMHLENCRVAYELCNSWHREQCTRQLVERIRQTLQLEDVTDTTTRELRQLLSCDRTVIYRFNSDWSGNFIAESVAAGWTPLAQLYVESPHLGGITVSEDDCSVQNWQPAMLLEMDTYLQESQGGEYRQGKPYSCVVDINQTDFEPCYPRLIKQMQAVAYLTVPIFVGGRLWGLLANYQNQGPRQWCEGDISLVMQIATQLGVALEHADLLEQTRRQALELAQAKTKVEAASQARTQFLANASHELRTPLNAILGFSKIMADELAIAPQGLPTTLAAEYREYVNIISCNGHNLLGLINHVLEMAHSESSQNQLLPSSLNLHQLLRDLQASSALKAEQKGIQIHFRLDPHIPQIIICDRDKLFKVLANLLNNAIESTQTGSVILRAAVIAQVKLEDDRSRLNLAFAVEDTGPGIDSVELQSLVQPLSDVDIAWQTNLESGLSLAVSRRFINLMGGDISVSSTGNHGSLFKFNIWAIADRPNAADIPPDVSQLEQTSDLSSPTYRVLIVDTQPPSSLSLKQFFQQIGCVLRTAHNNHEAFSIWHDWQPHLILIDPDLAILEGQSITQLTHRQAIGQESGASSGKSARTKVIALINSNIKSSDEPVTPHFDDTLIWPATKSSLLQILTQHLPLNDTQVIQLNLTHQLIRQDLAITPLQWRQQLYQAAITGSDNKLISLISQLSSKQSLLSKTLTAFTMNFRFEKIISLLENEKDA